MKKKTVNNTKRNENKLAKKQTIASIEIQKTSTSPTSSNGYLDVGFSPTPF